MTKKLEDLFGMSDDSEENGDSSSKPSKKRGAPPKDQSNSITARKVEEFDKINAALPFVKDLGDAADDELTDISERALKAYEDLMDLGMNVEARYSGRIFEVANSMLKTSLDAKSAKLDKKLKMIDLQLKKEKQDKGNGGDKNPNVLPGEGHIVSNRNSLIEQLKNLPKDK